MTWLFQILDLLAAFFQFVLEVHHKAGRLGVLNFVAAGGDFAEALLKREVKAPSGVGPDFKEIAQAFQMGMEAGEFFADVELPEGSGLLPVHR